MGIRFDEITERVRETFLNASPEPFLDGKILMNHSLDEVSLRTVNSLENVQLLALLAELAQEQIEADPEVSVWLEGTESVKDVLGVVASRTVVISLLKTDPQVVAEEALRFEKMTEADEARHQSVEA